MTFNDFLIWNNNNGGGVFISSSGDIHATVGKIHQCRLCHYHDQQKTSSTTDVSSMSPLPLSRITNGLQFRWRWLSWWHINQCCWWSGHRRVHCTEGILFFFFTHDSASKHYGLVLPSFLFRFLQTIIILFILFYIILHLGWCEPFFFCGVS